MAPSFAPGGTHFKPGMIDTKELITPINNTSYHHKSPINRATPENTNRTILINQKTPKIFPE